MLKLGRNDRCHCGSGKKYKKCCLEADKTGEQRQLRPAEAAIATPANTGGGDAITIGEVRRLAFTEMNWGNEMYSQLADHLIQQMEPSYEPEHVLEAVSTWNKFSTLRKPVIRKVGAFCAALEYMISEAFGQPTTQNNLAQKYLVSASTVGKKYQELVEFVQEHAAGYSSVSEPRLA
ncbi:SEC-C metal-binding domain-containing protein [Paenibacillus validus]|uniref:SEC-C metal-binding domain-containing protein n=1 Tax=Paenibacillus TaxID=44249 RepID=UPI0013DE9BC6|nr:MULTISPECIES: SEC-C metal-binding domain-containing protein [Paenibacillus]MED4603685.1 SEC-C metal-binding domain-containing protein [Paenibacillus validus]MED4609428.1 SEC-C metal-binding domain-containing protein [Paenibacillus validus]